MKKKRTIPPRVTSQYSYTIYDELCKITDNIDFKQTIFEGRYKRNRSVGSAQALIVELALTDDRIAPLMIARLRQFMERGGKDWIPSIWYGDKY